MLNCVHPAAVNGRLATVPARRRPDPRRARAGGARAGDRGLQRRLHSRDLHRRSSRATVSSGSISRRSAAARRARHQGRAGRRACAPDQHLEPAGRGAGDRISADLLRYELVDGSGGPGTYRGGMGLRRVYRAEARLPRARRRLAPALAPLGPAGRRAGRARAGGIPGRAPVPPADGACWPPAVELRQRLARLAATRPARATLPRRGGARPGRGHDQPRYGAEVRPARLSDRPLQSAGPPGACQPVGSIEYAPSIRSEQFIPGRATSSSTRASKRRRPVTL